MLIEERCLGGLLGLLVGDALGSFFEGHEANWIRADFPTPQALIHRLPAGLGVAAVEPRDGDHSPAPAPTARSSDWTSALTFSCFIFIEALLTTRRELTAQISSTGSSPFARRVLPVSTRSTIRSASPTSGASSMEP